MELEWYPDKRNFRKQILNNLISITVDFFQRQNLLHCLECISCQNNTKGQTLKCLIPASQV